MANDIARTDRADRWKRAANLACSAVWNPDQVMVDCDATDLAEVERILRRSPRPLSETEPDGRSRSEPDLAGKFTTALGDGLALLYLKLSPNGSADQSGAWVRAMQASLDDLAGEVAVRATKAALRRPMRFHNEVDGVIREEAAKIMASRVMAATRIAKLRDSLAALPAPAGEDDQTGPVALSLATIAAIPDALCRIGVAHGWLTPEQISEARGTVVDGDRSAYVPDEKAA